MKTSAKTTMYERLTAHATWMVRVSALSSRRELAAWIMPALSEPAASAFREILPLYSAVQIDAENQLCAFLISQNALCSPRNIRQKSDHARRTTDWAHTYEHSIFPTPLTYFDTLAEELPDLAVMRALVTLASRWADLLKRTGFEKREQRLREALTYARREWRRMEPVTQRTLARLEIHDQDLAKALRLALFYWIGASTENDAEAFGNALKAAIENEKKSLKSSDNKLFELDVMWGVTRAIIDPQDTTKKTERWTLKEDPINLQRKEPTSGFGEVALFLKRGDLACRITKTKPNSLLRCEGHEVDRVAALAKDYGADAHGFTPDIVFHFTHAKYADCHLFALGDPKNYHGSPMMEAIKTTGAAYLLVYAPLFGTGDTEDKYFGFASAVRPAVTLFFANQDLKQVVRHDSKNTAALTHMFHSDELPPIMVFDERHFSDPEGSSEAWTAPVVRAWFERITKDVENAFRDGRTYKLPLKPR